LRQLLRLARTFVVATGDLAEKSATLASAADNALLVRLMPVEKRAFYLRRLNVLLTGLHLHVAPLNGVRGGIGGVHMLPIVTPASASSSLSSSSSSMLTIGNVSVLRRNTRDAPHLVPSIEFYNSKFVICLLMFDFRCAMKCVCCATHVMCRTWCHQSNSLTVIPCLLFTLLVV
jgi:hypothetical protein